MPEDRDARREVERWIKSLEFALAEAARQPERRRWERYQAEFPLTYRRSGELYPRLARLLDISRGGIRLRTAEELSPGEVIKVSVDSSARAPGGVLARLEALAEVVRVRPHRGGAAEACYWDIGLRFVAAEGAPYQERERREHPRYMADFPLSYRRLPDRARRSGRVRNISQSGMRLVVEEELRPGEVLALLTEEPPASPVKLSLGALGRVVRTRRLGRHFELGVEFVKNG